MIEFIEFERLMLWVHAASSLILFILNKLFLILLKRSVEFFMVVLLNSACMILGDVCLKLNSGLSVMLLRLGFLSNIGICLFSIASLIVFKSMRNHTISILLF